MSDPSAIAYLRVSTVGQAADGVSLEAQRGRVEAWATANGRALAAVHVDAGISGAKTRNRPALAAALRDACRRRRVLVVYSLSRLARSTRDAIDIAERLSKAGADLVSLTEQIDTTTASGKMVFRMLAVLAEFERDLVAERTRSALAHLRRQGHRISRFAPLGYDLDGTRVVPNAAEQGVLATIRELHINGLSLRQIGAELSARGISTKNGLRAWSPNVIRTVLRREPATTAEGELAAL